MNDVQCEIWKWRDRLVVFPRVGDADGWFVLNQPIEAAGGYRGLFKSINAARRAAHDAGEMVDFDERAVYADGKPIYSALGCPDRRTFIREAVACGLMKGLVDGFPELELVGRVGVPKKKTHWRVEKRGLPYDASAKEIVAEVRDLLEKMESLRGKPVKFLTAR